MGQSRILIILISKWYAYSTSCLDELVHILNFFKLKNQLVCPIFYEVEASDIRYLRNSFGEAMAQHEDTFGVHSDKVKQWKSALYDVSNFSGWHLQTNRECDEHAFAIKIAKWMTRSLNSYDVFVSYSGKDIRYSFSGYLYNALHLAGFNTFMDEEEWVNGEQKNSQFHIKAIEESKFSIIVLSKNYAFSLCCLDALVKILECKKLKKHNVFPIFYKVEPSHVRYQTSPEFSKAMALYEDMFGKESERVKKWRLALFEVSNFKGWHFQNGVTFLLVWYKKMGQELGQMISVRQPSPNSNNDPYSKQRYLCLKDMVVEFIKSHHHVLNNVLILILMANNSNSNANATHQLNYEYDIYLSYSGLFTLFNFPSFFSQILRDKGFQVFHNTCCNQEDNKNPLFSLRIMGQSRILIILISKWYAYSTSCLDELVHILNFFKLKNQLVCPIFYEVEASDIRYLRNSFGEAMAQHEDTFGVHSDKVKQWKSALYDVSNFSGWHLQTNR
ncbi:PREDICTED: uncharacterized protein LOC109328467 [Lupinus angustifolius]|uniref:uncharacterized protein LOC109328467 n=1 Tax=Lupinus angustifolius TaxID=3871 RepID=UPI00092E2D3F|nr:PREDICTED: uncharacterized protein LOC109328467 [Lupinus angustifolius]